MEYATLYIFLALAFGLYMTWGVGANDVANAMGTSVGSGAITVRNAIVIAAVFEFTGAFLAGGHVTGTIRKGIIDPAYIPSPEILIYGMLSALLASGLWLMVASYFGWPVSTTHTIVGSLVGFGVVGLGFHSVVWSKVGEIVASWVVSPLLGATLAFLLAVSVRRLILDTDEPFENAKRFGPVYVFFMGVLIGLVTLFKGLKHLSLDLNGWQSLGVAVGRRATPGRRRQTAPQPYPQGRPRGREGNSTTPASKRCSRRSASSRPARWPSLTDRTTSPTVSGRSPPS